MYHHSCSFVLCLVALVLSGCGSSASISGTVTYKGEKVKSGSLTFTPMGKDTAVSGKPAYASIKEDGSFSVAGAVIGRNQVLFIPANSTDPVELKPGQSAPSPRYAGLLPKQTEVEVKPGSNTIDIELVSPKGK